MIVGDIGEEKSVDDDTSDRHQNHSDFSEIYHIFV